MWRFLMKSKGRSGLDLMSLNLKKKEGKDSGVGRMALFWGGVRESRTKRREKATFVSYRWARLRSRRVWFSAPCAFVFFLIFKSTVVRIRGSLVHILCWRKRKKTCRLSFGGSAACSRHQQCIAILSIVSIEISIFSLFFFTPEIFDWGILFLNN
ncbi:Uncharacterized protein APZ42_012165 [Daphnia magna]|uniref:Transmembrane protein n=1 Tax=Daphnia magna TaxID=35525 RepID=A0A162S5E2_9CRUS|nr:Uncharacterized protein APZ42_012165 [Daphnia magna]